MNILIVTAHPMAGSFTAALAGALCTGAQTAGRSVETADLCAEGFQPVLGPDDMGHYAGAAPPAEIRREMDRVARADILIFVFPVWWWSVPAVLKGWFDRVLRSGWAWSDAPGTPATVLADKRVLMLATTGDSAAGFARCEATLRQQLCEGVWGFCRVAHSELHVFHELHGQTPPEVRQRYLADAQEMGRAF